MKREPVGKRQLARILERGTRSSRKYKADFVLVELSTNRTLDTLDNFHFAVAKRLELRAMGVDAGLFLLQSNGYLYRGIFDKISRSWVGYPSGWRRAQHIGTFV